MKLAAAAFVTMVGQASGTDHHRPANSNWLEVTWKEPDLAGAAGTTTERSFVVPGGGWYVIYVQFQSGSGQLRSPPTQPPGPSRRG